MKNIIKRILNEDANLKVLTKYITKDLQKQVSSGKIPMLDFTDLARKKLSENYYDEIINIYFDFVGGPEEAFKLFKTYIVGKTISDDDLRKSGVAVMEEDIYKIKIYKIFNESFEPGDELEFVFDIVSGQFVTSQGVLTLKELYKEEYDDIWVDVTDHLRSEIEFYILNVASDFGLYFDVATSHWS